MSAGDVLKADETGDSPETAANTADETVKKPDAAASASVEGSQEDRDDDAWIDACRAEGTSESDDDDSVTAEAKAAGEKVKDFNAGVEELSADVEKLRLQNEDGKHDAVLADLTGRVEAMEETGTEAISKLGQAMGVIAERIDDLEDRAQETVFDRVAESASPSHKRSDVAPYIENAERELEAAKKSGPTDIFDRIAQAAESEFDESRGSTAQRVSKLVDDRRVGTKKWTPSKTVKARMEKLEAARLAAEASAAEAETKAAETTAKVSETKADTADSDLKAPQETKPEQVEETPVAEEKIVISRRDKQEHVEDESSDAAGVAEKTASDASDSTEDEADDAEALRIVPGARGRRRDRARKSRLDEDFEKIFEGEEGKPSIGSLRRKLRTGSQQAEAENTEETAKTEDTTEPSVTEETFGADAETAAPVAKAGFFARLFKRNPKPAVALKPKARAITSPHRIKDTATTSDATEAMVEAFEADEKDLGPALDFEDTEAKDDEKWEKVDSEVSEPRTSKTLVIGAMLVAAVGVGVFIYRAFLGG